jgi:hypothetical protein
MQSTENTFSFQSLTKPRFRVFVIIDNNNDHERRHMQYRYTVDLKLRERSVDTSILHSELEDGKL